MATMYDPRFGNPMFGNPNVGFSNPQQQWAMNPSMPNPSPPLVPQPQATLQIPCRVIANPADITPSEIPMDGRVSLFLANDNSFIIAKQWNQNGLIDTVRYLPERPTEAAQAESVPFNEEVISRLDRLEAILEGLRPNTKTKATTSKEASSNDT